MKHTGLFLITLCLLLPYARLRASDDILVIINADESVRRTIDPLRLERLLVLSNGARRPVLRTFPAGSPDKALFLASIRNGRFEEAAALVTNIPGTAGRPRQWLMISLVPDTADPERVFLSSLFYDIPSLKKHYSFLEEAIGRTEGEIIRTVLEKVIRPATHPASRVDTFKPISVCFLIDNSGSMIKNDNDFNPKDLFYRPEQTARAGAVRLVFNRLTVNDEVAFIFFAGDVTAFEDRFRKIKDPRRLNPLADRVVRKVGMLPGTDIGEALKKARRIVSRASYSNVYVIFLSDGNPTQGETDFRKLRGYVRQHLPGIPFFVIGLEGEETESGYNLEKNFLKDLAYETGGTFNIIRLRDTLESRYGEVARSVDNIFNIIRKEQTLFYEEPSSRTEEEGRMVYSWDFTINSVCSEFTILLEPWETGWEVLLTAPDGTLLDGKSLSLTPLVRSALCRVTREDCKGAWKLRVRLPAR